ncbi:hypothetical protein BpHYR1_050465 [Brachionus plicatilis]|uniref:Uncharacterized protein n=1 Tax=Brachionus plicatilis TaxID=10195 RepID=A0A3M7P2U8_BRAPC|nr:hypothetical protein BpHYR1_050465 [Brachionus plicatilis]
MFVWIIMQFDSRSILYKINFNGATFKVASTKFHKTERTYIFVTYELSPFFSFPKLRSIGLAQINK